MDATKYYPDVHHVEELPVRRGSDSRVVSPGFAVTLGGKRFDPTWVFFTALEPAAAFGRAARMSAGDIGSYGVFKALRIIEYNEETRSDETTLYVTGGGLDRSDDEMAVLQRWLAGVSVRSSHFQSPRS